MLQKPNWSVTYYLISQPSVCTYYHCGMAWTGWDYSELICEKKEALTRLLRAVMACFTLQHQWNSVFLWKKKLVYIMIEFLTMNTSSAKFYYKNRTCTCTLNITWWSIILIFLSIYFCTSKRVMFNRISSTLRSKEPWTSSNPVWNPALWKGLCSPLPSVL